MDNKAPAILGDVVEVPQIVITKPSPVISNTSVVSVAEVEKAGREPEDTSVAVSSPNQNGPSNGQSQTEAGVSKEPEGNSSGEFAPAQECVECHVIVPEPEMEPESQSIEATTATSDPDPDDFRSASTTTGCCGTMFLACLMCYGRFFENIGDRCRLPFWLVLMSVPLAAAVMGSVYMYSCPAADTLPSAVFSVGMALMAVLTIRVAIILHRLTRPDNNLSQALHTLLLIATFITVLFFLSESVLFWQMDSTSKEGSDKFCDATFVSFGLVWNCVMWVVMVPVVFFPA